jgi:glycosyltransferase involved in cell wall biosynthesis
MLNIVFLGGEDVSARIDISSRLINLGCNIEIIGSEEEEVFVKNNISYTKFNLNREFSILDDIKSILSIRRILRKYEKQVVVHAFDTKLTMFLPIAAIGLKRIKVVRTINGMGRLFTSKSAKSSLLVTVYKLIQRAVKRRVDYTIFQNTDNYKYFLKHNLVSEEKSIVIKSSGINLKEYSVPIAAEVKDELSSEYITNKEAPTFILVSRLIKQKGISNYLEAAKLCHENGYNFNFLLVGQIDSNKDAVSLEKINSYNKCVNYLGRKTNIKELLSISDIFVLPTFYSEGVPRVLLEASAMSLALITTNMPGCNDVLVDEFNGKMINIDDTQDLYHKMIYLLKDNETLSFYKNNALKHVQNFSLEKVTNECLNVYTKVSN